MSDPNEYRPPSGSIPTDPGVYRFKDPHGRIVYVGKAKNLRARLNSYFQDFSGLHARTQQMVTTASSVDWVTVDTEVEALVLEYSWIKEFSPRFNVRFRDDKSYPYLAISVSDTFPRVSVVREAKRKGTKYFGPYAHAWAVRATLDELIRVFPVRSCREGVFRQAERSNRACLLGYIDKCSAPCVGHISESDYRSLVNDLIKFLSGQSTNFLKQTRAKMVEAAQLQDYESAAKWRDRVLALERVLEQNAVAFDDSTDADVIAVVFGELDIGVQIFHVRSGRITGQRFMVVERSEDLSTGGYVQRVLTRIYSDVTQSGIPREILVTEMPDDPEVLTTWLESERGSRLDLRVPQRGDKRTILATAVENAERSLERHVIERSSDITVRTQSLNALQDALDLTEPPLRIECIDISTLQGSDTVASLVVFEDGLPKKKDYRTFIIKGEKTDDLASIAEVVTRRFAEGQTPLDHGKFSYPPSLLVIDGARGQASAAATVLRDLGLSIPVVGLAKRLEEVWLPDSNQPLILPRNSPALHLLQRVRDEAHRVAIGFHRKRRGKRSLLSGLDAIVGLGQERRKALIHHFGSVSAVRDASIEELRAVPGIGNQLAESIHASLNPEQVETEGA